MPRLALAALALAAVLGVHQAAPSARSACPRDAHLGAVAFARGGALHLLNLGTCRDRVLVARGVQPPVRFTPDGRSIRYGNRWVVHVAGGKPRRVAAPEALISPNRRLLAEVRVRRAPGSLRGKQIIWVTERSSGRGHAAYTVHESYRRIPAGAPGPIGLVGWSPDSRWLLFYIDPMGSQSLAADGLELQAVAVRGGRPRQIAGMLLYPDYMTWCGRRLLVTAGGSRLATENKWVAVATSPDWHARRLTRAPARAWGSLACAPDRRKVVVLSQRVSHDYNFAHTHWSLWLLGLDGSQRRLTTPPMGSTDESPRWSRDGRTILFDRTRKLRGSLMLRRGGRVVGPIAPLGRELGYYGHHDWWDAADWHQ